MKTVLNKEHELSQNQFGGRMFGGCNADSAREQRRVDRHCTVVSIDVKNALNSVSLKSIAVAFQRMQVLKGYFKSRTLMYEKDKELKSMRMIAAVSRDSYPGPTLWIGMYDGFLIQHCTTKTKKWPPRTGKYPRTSSKTQ